MATIGDSQVTNIVKKYKRLLKKLPVAEELKSSAIKIEINGKIEVEYSHFQSQNLSSTHSTAFSLRGPKTGLDKKLERGTKLTWAQKDRNIVTGDEPEVKELETQNKTTTLSGLADKFVDIFI
jgi:hypothetical protein